MKCKHTIETLHKPSLLKHIQSLDLKKNYNNKILLIQISLFFAALDLFTCKRPMVEVFNNKIISTTSAKNTVIQSFELRVSSEDHPLQTLLDNRISHGLTKTLTIIGHLV